MCMVVCACGVSSTDTPDNGISLRLRLNDYVDHGIVSFPAGPRRFPCI